MKLLVAFALGLGLQRFAAGRAGSAAALGRIEALVGRVEEVDERLEQRVVPSRWMTTRWVAGMLVALGGLVVTFGFAMVSLTMQPMNDEMRAFRQQGAVFVDSGVRMVYLGVILGVWTLIPWAEYYPRAQVASRRLWRRWVSRS